MASSPPLQRVRDRLASLRGKGQSYVTLRFGKFGKLMSPIDMGNSLPRNTSCRKPNAVGVDDITLMIVSDGNKSNVKISLGGEFVRRNIFAVAKTFHRGGR